MIRCDFYGYIPNTGKTVSLFWTDPSIYNAAILFKLVSRNNLSETIVYSSQDGETMELYISYFIT